MTKFPLFLSKSLMDENWNMGFLLGDAYQKLFVESSSGRKANAFITRAAFEMSVELFNPSPQQSSRIAINQISDRSYLCETPYHENAVIISYWNASSGVLKAMVKPLCAVPLHVSPVPSFNQKSDNVRVPYEFIFAPVLADILTSKQFAYTSILDILSKAFRDFADEAENFLSGKECRVEDKTLLLVSNSVIRGIEDESIKINTKSNSIPMLTLEELLAFSQKGTLLCGKPKFIVGEKKESQDDNIQTFAEAKKWAEEHGWKDDREWTEQEKLLIPSFPDSFPINPEVLKFAHRYVSSKNGRNPMVNFMWRGGTAIGKSTGVEMLAGILNMPLLRFTCNSTNETQDFLSTMLPIPASEQQPRAELPTIEDMTLDPVFAYEKITGKKDEQATPDQCLAAYVQAVNSTASESTRFKVVESTFVQALSKGYIVEIQECSRIRDPGVLVGLNEFDRPGSLVPLVDGTFVKRDPRAIAFYTDNVGFASCRPLDPSVIRRMAFIKDSYELPQKDAIARIMFNTGVKNKTLLNKMYKVWQTLKTYCIENDINEGSVSLTELERWVQVYTLDKKKAASERECLMETAVECLVTKATNDPEEQKNIIQTVLELSL